MSLRARKDACLSGEVDRLVASGGRGRGSRNGRGGGRGNRGRGNQRDAEADDAAFNALIGASANKRGRGKKGRRGERERLPLAILQEPRRPPSSESISRLLETWSVLSTVPGHLQLQRTTM